MIVKLYLIKERCFINLMLFYGGNKNEKNKVVLVCDLSSLLAFGNLPSIYAVEKLSTDMANMEDYSIQNKEVALNDIIDGGYNKFEASEVLRGIDISGDELLVGVSVSREPLLNRFTNMAFYRSYKPKKYTRTYYLSKSQVVTVRKNIKRNASISSIVSTALGLTTANPVFGIIVGAAPLGNPRFRDAIERAYYQKKRLKIVYNYNGSMSLNTVYYYVVN